jgi:hypothetical protein
MIILLRPSLFTVPAAVPRYFYPSAPTVVSATGTPSYPYLRFHTFCVLWQHKQRANSRLCLLWLALMVSARRRNTWTSAVLTTAFTPRRVNPFRMTTAGSVFGRALTPG